MIPKIGDTATITKKITQEDIHQFAELVGDLNPVHVDEEFAKKTRFGKPIAHGMWGASLISAVLGTKLPGPGTIYLSQTIKFLAPIFLGDTITARVEVINLRREKAIVTFHTVCENQDGKRMLEGEAVVLVEQVD
jgi:acyl dehydratase